VRVEKTDDREQMREKQRLDGDLTEILAAIALLAIDVAALSALQAEMIYRIAAIYGRPLRESTRRGEVCVIWSLSAGGSGLLKTGLSGIEILPAIGMIVGAASNATLLYGAGRIARELYASEPTLD
jgi:uncharacterized protein (DUF697 family)